MTIKDWYRNKDWNKKIEDNFFAKLNHSRSQKFEYIVIQASSLTKTHPQVALHLVKLYFDTRKDKFNDASALLARADSLFELKDINKSMDSYRAVLAREDEFPNFQTSTYVQYPYIVATRKITSEYNNALKTLKKYKSRLAFPLDYFMWYSAKALIENRFDLATKALETAEIKKSGFRFHQSLGLVGKSHQDTIKRLLKIST